MPATTGRRWPPRSRSGSPRSGWLASPEVRAILGERGIDAIGAAIIANLGGFVAGVAFLRGVPYARLPPDPRPIGTALAVGTPGIALAAIVGGMVGEPWRSAFLDQTTGEVVVFLVAGIASLTLSRLTLVGSGSGAGSVDWRRNPAWLGLAALLLAGIAVTAFATSAVAGPLIVTALGVAIPSLLVLGFFVGFDRRSIRIVAICAAIALFIAQLLKVLGARPRRPPGAADAVARAADRADRDHADDAGAGRDRRRARGRRGHRADHPVDAAAAGRRGRRGRGSLDRPRRRDRPGAARPAAARVAPGRRRPADAVAAYRELLEDLAPRPGVRREDGETPAEHASRLRDAGAGALGLDLLAADYGLVRFGGVRLSDAEERRAVRRASILRRLLVGQRLASTSAGSGPGAAARPGEDAAPGDGPGARSRFRVG